jgi:hypothetical protein
VGWDVEAHEVIVKGEGASKASSSNIKVTKTKTNTSIACSLHKQHTTHQLTKKPFGIFVFLLIMEITSAYHL